MALRGKKPSKIEKRLKVLFYGAAGVGKTTAAIQFPAPYLIDTERGAENDQYVKLLEEKNGAIFQTSEIGELITEVKALLSEEHSYKTLIIDPLTIVYNDLVENCAKEVGTEWGRHYGEANKTMKHLLNLLLRLDMNVIITSHQKNVYGEELAVLGQTFDCYKKLDYLFDLVFEIQKRGKERIGVVKKTRIESFVDFEQFPFSYDTLANKYGREILERDAIPESLATLLQVEELKGLIELLHVPETLSNKWLSKSKANTFDEITKENMQKIINSLTEKFQPTPQEPQNNEI